MTDGDNDPGLGLNARQRRFGELYATSLNATQAYKDAGYKTTNDHAASAAASRLLSDARVKALVAKLQGETSSKLGIKREDVIRELQRIAFANISDAVDWDDTQITLRASKAMSADQTAAIASLSTNANGMQLRFHSKIEALKLLAQIVGLLREEDDGQKRGNITLVFGGPVGG